MSAKLSTFIISLPGSEASVSASLSELSPQLFQLHSPIGVLGRMLPDVVCRQLTRDPNSLNNKGALGCMLSHIRVWEMIIKAELEFALIIEDDVTSRYPERLLVLQFPPEFDLVFCNDRTCKVSTKPEADELEFRAVSSVIRYVNDNGKSVGTDAYIVSRAGAEKLVQYFSQDLYFGHVDMRMFAYSLESDTIKQTGIDSSFTRELLQNRALTKERQPLNAYVLTAPVFHHTSAGSRRVTEDELGRAGARAFELQ